MKRNLVIVLAGIVVTVSAIASLLNTPAPNQISPPQDVSMFSYDAYPIMRDDLGMAGIIMSSPITLQGESTSTYCTFFEGVIPEYCTSTEMKDSDGIFLGNIHMIGTILEPQVALGVMQSDAEGSQIPHITAMTKTMIERLVCQCWHQMSPDGFGSIPEWIEQTALHHTEQDHFNTISRIDGLPLPVLMEVTTVESGYQWKLLIGTPP